MQDRTVCEALKALGEYKLVLDRLQPDEIPAFLIDILQSNATTFRECITSNETEQDWGKTQFTLKNLVMSAVMTHCLANLSYSKEHISDIFNTCYRRSVHFLDPRLAWKHVAVSLYQTATDLDSTRVKLQAEAHHAAEKLEYDTYKFFLCLSIIPAAYFAYRDNDKQEMIKLMLNVITSLTSCMQTLKDEKIFYQCQKIALILLEPLQKEIQAYYADSKMSPVDSKISKLATLRFTHQSTSLPALPSLSAVMQFFSQTKKKKKKKRGTKPTEKKVPALVTTTPLLSLKKAAENFDETGDLAAFEVFMAQKKSSVTTLLECYKWVIVSRHTPVDIKLHYLNLFHQLIVKEKLRPIALFGEMCAVLKNETLSDSLAEKIRVLCLVLGATKLARKFRPALVTPPMPPVQKQPAPKKIAETRETDHPVVSSPSPPSPAEEIAQPVRPTYAEALILLLQINGYKTFIKWLAEEPEMYIKHKAYEALIDAALTPVKTKDYYRALLQEHKPTHPVGKFGLFLDVPKRVLIMIHPITHDTYQLESPPFMLEICEFFSQKLHECRAQAKLISANPEGQVAYMKPLLAPKLSLLKRKCQTPEVEQALICIQSAIAVHETQIAQLLEQYGVCLARLSELAPTR